MTEQTRLIAADPPEAWMERAGERWSPIRTFCLFSGGNDSGVLAHRMRDHYDELFFIDTGVCLPTTMIGCHRIEGVEEFVRGYAEWLGKPLTIRRSGDAFERMVLGDDLWWERFEAERRTRPGLSIEEMIEGDKAAERTSSAVYGEAPYGFPGKGQHSKAYSRLKERRIEEQLRITKEGHSRSAEVLFVSGIRRAESKRRQKREPLTERFAAKFVNPLIEWTNAEMGRYRREHDIPQSDVAALLHRSGECNCGAFARVEEERKTLMECWPDWWAKTIAPLEEEAKRRGIRWCIWGGYDLEGNQAADDGREAFLCDNCERLI